LFPKYLNNIGPSSDELLELNELELLNELLKLDELLDLLELELLELLEDELLDLELLELLEDELLDKDELELLELEVLELELDDLLLELLELLDKLVAQITHPSLTTKFLNRPSSTYPDVILALTSVDHSYMIFIKSFVAVEMVAPAVVGEPITGFHSH